MIRKKVISEIDDLKPKTLGENIMKRCALYTRVSTTMQAEKDYGSCEAQRDKILSYVKSQEDLEVVKEYSDPGFSGSNLERPALKELLNDIANKKIDRVLTYKIDRLTRSSKDFYSLIEFCYFLLQSHLRLFSHSAHAMTCAQTKHNTH